MSGWHRSRAGYDTCSVDAVNQDDTRECPFIGVSTTNLRRSLTEFVVKWSPGSVRCPAWHFSHVVLGDGGCHWLAT